MQYYDAIIIRFTGEKGGVHNIFVDGGDKKSRKICYTDKLKKELETLFGMGESIDLWVITHVDDDHIEGLCNFINDTIHWYWWDIQRQVLQSIWHAYHVSLQLMATSVNQQMKSSRRTEPHWLVNSPTLKEISSIAMQSLE